LDLARRVLHEFRPRAAVTNGEAPEQFLERKNFLWEEDALLPPTRIMAGTQLEYESN
jgi:hypothetical protein